MYQSPSKINLNIRNAVRTLTSHYTITQKPYLQYNCHIHSKLQRNSFRKTKRIVQTVARVSSTNQQCVTIRSITQNNKLALLHFSAFNGVYRTLGLPFLWKCWSQSRSVVWSCIWSTYAPHSRWCYVWRVHAIILKRIQSHTTFQVITFIWSFQVQPLWPTHKQRPGYWNPSSPTSVSVSTNYIVTTTQNSEFSF